MEQRTDPLFGTMMWGGVFLGMPACIGSYNNGASLYVFRDDKWVQYAKCKSMHEAMPHPCGGCGRQLPMPEEDYVMKKTIEQLGKQLIEAIVKQAEKEHTVLDFNNNGEPKVADEVRIICKNAILAARMHHGPVCGLCQS